MRGLKNLLILLLGAVVLTSCSTAIKAIKNSWRNSYVTMGYLKKYLPKHIKAPKKKIGTKSITFYVTVKDSRKDKFIFHKPGYAGPLTGIIKGGYTKFRNPRAAARYATYLALKNCGWGVTDNSTRADYTVNVNLLTWEYVNYPIPFVPSTQTTKADICVINNMNHHVAVHAHVKAVKYWMIEFDPNKHDAPASFLCVGTQLAHQLYNELVKVFNSSKFARAVEKAWKLKMEGKNGWKQVKPVNLTNAK